MNSSNSFFVNRLWIVGIHLGWLRSQWNGQIDGWMDESVGRTKNGRSFWFCQLLEVMILGVTTLPSSVVSGSLGWGCGAQDDIFLEQLQLFGQFLLILPLFSSGTIRNPFSVNKFSVSIFFSAKKNYWGLGCGSSHPLDGRVVWSLDLRQAGANPAPSPVASEATHHGTSLCGPQIPVGEFLQEMPWKVALKEMKEQEQLLWSWFLQDEFELFEKKTLTISMKKRWV